jgi:hypothetical protein
MKKPHGGDKNDSLPLTANTIGAHLHLRYSGYDFDDIHLKILKKTIEQQKLNVNRIEIGSFGIVGPLWKFKEFGSSPKELE